MPKTDDKDELPASTSARRGSEDISGAIGIHQGELYASSAVVAGMAQLTSKSDVTRNYAEKSINNILDYVGGEGKVSCTLSICQIV